MKKNHFICFYANGLAFSTQAQDISKNALGLRFADNGGFGENYLTKELCLAITV
jgi:hypothetical protein